MKIYKTEHVPAHDKQTWDKSLCDFCNIEVGGLTLYSVDDVTISYEYGDSYPGDKSTELVSVDMCGNCFKDKLRPWIESNMLPGRKMEKEE